MKLEELTKTQIVLLTLLVSFVTSIATGIVTVSLMDQAPAGVTQTINRVVERTIEKVVPASSKDSTVVVKEEDLAVDAIDNNSKSIVRISGTGTDGFSKFYSIGLVISKDGLIAANNPKNIILRDFEAAFADGKKYKISLVQNTTSAASDEVAFFKIVKDDKTPAKFTPVVLADSDSLKLGQTVIFIGGKTSNSVSLGIIRSLSDSCSGSDVSADSGTASSTATTTPASSAKAICGIETNISDKGGLGGPLLNLSGEVVGIKIGSAEETSALDSLQAESFLPANFLKKLIPKS